MVKKNSIYGKIGKLQGDLTDIVSDTTAVGIENLSTNVETIQPNLDTMALNLELIDEKIGETDDEYDDNTLFGRTKSAIANSKNSSFIYPTGTSSVVLTSGSGYVEAIPSNTITNPFRILGLLGVTNVSPSQEEIWYSPIPSDSSGWREFKIAQGASGSEVDIASTAAYTTDYSYLYNTRSESWYCPYPKVCSASVYSYNHYQKPKTGFLPITAPLLDANTRISIKLIGGTSATAKLVYQEYS